MKKIPELLLKCCGKIYKPHSIELLDNCIKITFYCFKCKNWIHLESKNGLKPNQRFDDGKSDDFPNKKLIDNNSNNQNNHLSFKYKDSDKVENR